MVTMLGPLKGTFSQFSDLRLYIYIKKNKDNTEKSANLLLTSGITDSGPPWKEKNVVQLVFMAFRGRALA